MSGLTPLAFLVLAHDDWTHLRRLVQRLAVHEQDTVVIHVDQRVDNRSFNQIKSELSSSNIIFTRRGRCFWGDYSLVLATFRCISALLESGRRYDYASLISGHDYPIRGINPFRKFLADSNGKEFIERFEMSKDNWTKNGLYEERYSYNFTRYPIFKYKARLTSAVVAANKLLGVGRAMPNGLIPFSGSQWWTLTRQAVEMIHSKADDKVLSNFFRTTLVPDEMFFHTIVANSFLNDRVTRCNLRYVSWCEDGRPEWLTNKHLDVLFEDNYFFARKVASWNNAGLLDLVDERISLE